MASFIVFISHILTKPTVYQKQPPYLSQGRDKSVRTLPSSNANFISVSSSGLLPDQEVTRQKDESSETRMLRWMHRYTRRDRIRNEDTEDNVGVATLADKMRM